MPAPTVLVVEDDPTILQLLEVNFEMEGFIVLRAEDAVAQEWAADAVRAQRAVLAQVERLPRRPSTIEVAVGHGADWSAALEGIGWTDGDLLGGDAQVLAEGEAQVGAGRGEDVAVEGDVPDHRVHERLRLRAVRLRSAAARGR